jgi:hypothetical protein
MSPARSKRQAQVQRRERAEILKAVGVVAGIVIVTVLLIWLLRPGPAGIPATGGLMNRQPRVSWLLGLAIGAGMLATWWILRRNPKAQARARVILPISLGVIVVAAVVGGVLWPGGLLRHDVAPAPAPPATTTPTTKPATSPTTAATPTTTATPTTAASPSTTGSP